jgi:hypothetical protein
VNPFRSRINPGLSCFKRGSVISFRASFTLGKPNSFAIGNINRWKKF